MKSSLTTCAALALMAALSLSACNKRDTAQGDNVYGDGHMERAAEADAGRVVAQQFDSNNCQARSDRNSKGGTVYRCERSGRHRR